jgi:hypothetical protein
MPLEMRNCQNGDATKRESSNAADTQNKVRVRGEESI